MKRLAVEMLACRAVILPLLALPGCKEVEPPIPPRPVLTMSVRLVDKETFGPFASTVEARYQTQLGFQLSGRMVVRDVYVGDVVRKGQRLAALDPTVTQFALDRARADVADARAQLVNAQGIESRQRLLASAGNTPQATLDNAVAGLATAKARLDQTEASLRMAQDQMGYSELHANFDGVVTAWSAEVGQYVTNGQGVVTIARPDVREAVVDIADDLMVNVKPGMIFTARLLVAPAIATKAVVREIGPLADSATRSHRVRLTLLDAPESFRIGTTIAVAVQRAVPPHVVLPRSAVMMDDGAPFVWVLSDDGHQVRRRRIALAGSSATGEGATVIATGGLFAGDRVIKVGVHSLHDGEIVGGTEGSNAGSTKAKETRP